MKALRRTASKAEAGKTRRDQLPAKPKKGSKRTYQAGRPTEEELARRKAKVVQVATAMFIRNGYAATSLVDIAKGARVATRTVYQHFGDKEAIFRTVMYAPETAAVYDPPTLRDDDTLFEAIMRVAQYVFDVSLRPTTIDMMRLAIAESRRFPDLIQKLTHATFMRFRSNVRQIFEQLMARGLVDDPDPAASAKIFIDLILGTNPILVYAGWEQSEEVDLQLESKVDLFISGRFGPKVAKKARTIRVNGPRSSAVGP